MADKKQEEVLRVKAAAPSSWFIEKNDRSKVNNEGNTIKASETQSCLKV